MRSFIYQNKSSICGFTLLVLILFVNSCNRIQQDLGLALVDKGRSKAESSHASTPGSNLDRIAFIKPGETVTIFDVKGPAVINHIWFTLNAARPNWYEPEGSATPGELIIRMYWDDAKEPAVESPFGDFFAAGFGLQNEIISIPVTVETGNGYNCYWQMPFHRAGKITITNDGKKSARGFYYQIDYTGYKKLPKNTAYFCAQYRQEFPEQTGRDYLIADIEGEGHYIGTVMSVRARSPLWFGEGDAKLYVDGEQEPSIWGTGTEDYFLCAWGMNECLFDYFGCTYMSSHKNLDLRYTLYRWHLKDPVRFTRSLRFEIEHNGWMSADETESGKEDGHVEREDDMATVALWYQVGQPKRFTALPPYEERILPGLSTIFEAEEMMGSMRHSPGKIRLEKRVDWTGEAQVSFSPATDHAWIEADFMIDKEEYQGLFIRMTHANNYGAYRIFLDGHPIPRNPVILDMDRDNSENVRNFMILNLFAGETTPGSIIPAVVSVDDHYLGSAALKKGKHTIRFEQVGKDPESLGNGLGFDSFRLMKRWNKKRPSLGPNSAISTALPRD